MLENFRNLEHANIVSHLFAADDDKFLYIATTFIAGTKQTKQSLTHYSILKPMKCVCLN